MSSNTIMGSHRNVSTSRDQSSILTEAVADHSFTPFALPDSYPVPSEDPFAPGNLWPCPLHPEGQPRRFEELKKLKDHWKKFHQDEVRPATPEPTSSRGKSQHFKRPSNNTSSDWSDSSDSDLDNEAGSDDRRAIQSPTPLVKIYEENEATGEKGLWNTLDEASVNRELLLGWYWLDQDTIACEFSAICYLLQAQKCNPDTNDTHLPFQPQVMTQ